MKCYYLTSSVSLYILYYSCLLALRTKLIGNRGKMTWKKFMWVKQSPWGWLPWFLWLTSFTFRWFVKHIGCRAMPRKLSIKSVPDYLWCGFILHSCVLKGCVEKATADLPEHNFYHLMRHWDGQGTVKHAFGFTLKGQKIACSCFPVFGFMLYIVNAAAGRKLIVLVWIKEVSQTAWAEETLDSHWHVIWQSQKWVMGSKQGCSADSGGDKGTG